MAGNLLLDLKCLEGRTVDSVEATREDRMLHFTIKSSTLNTGPKELSFSVVDEKELNDALDRIQKGLDTIIQKNKIVLKTLKEAD